MRILAACLLSLSLLCGCVPKSDLEAANSQISDLKAQVNDLKTAAATKDQRIAALEEKIAKGGQLLKAAAEKIDADTHQLAAANEQLQRKPPMPVKVGLRQALIGGGYVAVFSTTVKQELPLLVTIRSKALGTSKQFQLRVPSSGTAELGSSQGALIDPNDEIIVANTAFETATLHFTH